MLPFVGLIVFFTALFANRVMMTNAVGRLTSEEKLRLVDVIPKTNLYMAAILLLFLVGFVASISLFPQHSVVEMLSLLFLLFISVGVIVIGSYRRFIRMSISASYLRSYLIASALVIAGLIAMSALVLYQLLGSLKISINL